MGRSQYNRLRYSKTLTIAILITFSGLLIATFGTRLEINHDVIKITSFVFVAFGIIYFVKGFLR